MRATSDESYGTNRPLVSADLFGWWFQVRGIFVGSSQVMGCRRVVARLPYWIGVQACGLWGWEIRPTYQVRRDADTSCGGS